MNETKISPTRLLGKSGPRVSPLGLGCMGMSGTYGPSDRAESLATIHAALEAGISLIDTGDFYGMGHNELLISEALRGRKREDVVLSVKFGAMREAGGGWNGYDARPAAVKNFLAYSLNRLATDYIDVYRPARLDAKVPIEDTIGAIAEMVKAGYVKHVGLSEVGAETIRRAHAVHPIADLQIEYSIFSRGIEDGILQTCRELGIAITAYGVLARGLISSSFKAPSGPGDIRGHTPRFQGQNLDNNLALVAALQTIAAARGVSVSQIAIAWVSAQGEDIIPLVGARTRERLAQSMATLEIRLTQEDLDAVERAVPKGAAAGDRYAARQMQDLDSET